MSESDYGLGDSISPASAFNPFSVAETIWKQTTVTEQCMPQILLYPKGGLQSCCIIHNTWCRNYIWS